MQIVYKICDMLVLVYDLFYGTVQYLDSIAGRGRSTEKA
jgi:hypothetical protein